MPELPEVELAARIVRRAAIGRTITSARVLHPSQRRGLPDEAAASLAGDAIVAVWRRGKHQLLRLKSGRTLHVHFRMTGDWVVLPSRCAPLPSHARVVLRFDDRSAIALDDPRALSNVTLHEPKADPLPRLGPDATSPSFNARWLRERCAGRRVAIKGALLDQRVVAGIGNIHASEALWLARLDPRVVAAGLTPAQYRAVVIGVKRTMALALARQRRYGTDANEPESYFVYGREGEPCRRCRTPVRRILQGARSSYFCPRCQRR
ncbi:MAG: Formamidopyrimidine-DNA glycosylase [Gemmatimonadaceae bacterium]|nr:Formamidopyrimidine-DNA glycosylase [Gemmatimonadaceae bacterium]